MSLLIKGSFYFKLFSWEKLIQFPHFLQRKCGGDPAFGVFWNLLKVSKVSTGSIGLLVFSYFTLIMHIIRIITSGDPVRMLVKII